MKKKKKISLKKRNVGITPKFIQKYFKIFVKILYGSSDYDGKYKHNQIEKVYTK